MSNDGILETVGVTVNITAARFDYKLCQYEPRAQGYRKLCLNQGIRPGSNTAFYTFTHAIFLPPNMHMIFFFFLKSIRKKTLYLNNHPYIRIYQPGTTANREAHTLITVRRELPTGGRAYNYQPGNGQINYGPGTYKNRGPAYGPKIWKRGGRQTFDARKQILVGSPKIFPAENKIWERSARISRPRQFF